MKKIIFFILFLTLSFSVYARKPAVEPVMGISIDEEKPVPPSKLNTGFTFSPNQTQNRAPQSLPENGTDFVTPLVFISMMLILPTIVWFGVMRNIKIASDEEAEKKKEKLAEHDSKKAA